MQVNDKMIQAAVSKAVALGLLPRKGRPEDLATNQEIMAEILEAAVDAYCAAENKGQSDNGQAENTGA